MCKCGVQNLFFYLMAFIIMAPLTALILEALLVESDTFEFLIDNVLDDVLINSLAVAIITGIGVLVVGVSNAWLVVQYSFLGRGFLQWALFMPLAFPAYILAYVYTDFFDAAGAFAQGLGGLGLGGLLPDLRTIWGASFILTFCLYPYVYLFARNGFLAGSRNQIESAALLGGGRWSQFFAIALPAARPFIIVGLMLVIMEVFADYGTMDYFGIRVFSTVIYNSWSGYGDIAAAARMSVLLLGFVFFLVFFEKNQRGKMRFYGSEGLGVKTLPGRRGGIVMTLFCSVPVMVGFVFPMLIMLALVCQTIDLMRVFQTLPYLWNTLLSAIIVGILGVMVAFYLVEQRRCKPNKTKNVFFAFCGFGYALPGIILGLGLLLMSSFFSSFGVLVTGAFAFLLLGYLIRFLNAALQGIDAGYEKISPSIGDAGQLMQSSRFSNLWHIKLPLLWPSMLSAGLVIAVEVIKELPLTLVLRPFDFDTLAVHTYNLASDERLAEAAFPALCIVVAGCVPVLLLQKFSRSL